jgi:hypothetical protein
LCPSLCSCPVQGSYFLAAGFYTVTHVNCAVGELMLPTGVKLDGIKCSVGCSNSNLYVSSYTVIYLLDIDIES